MREIVPDYYSQFKCTTSACRHSCCIGWEIDVDDESLEKYRNIPGALGQELGEVITHDGGCAHFRLGEDGRCPFLNEKNLCRLILAEGEEILCQICRDHPRFRSEFSHCEEMGVGLACEEAARLILAREKPMTLLTISDDGGDEEPDEYETDLLALRTSLFTILEGSGGSVEERLETILDSSGASLPDYSWEQWMEIYRSLERLDNAWNDILDTFTLPEKPLDRKWDPPFLNLAAYFLYRHLPNALYTGFPLEHVSFAVLSTRVIRHLFAVSHTQNMETLVELVRMYSSEVEYSEDNTDALLNYCG